MRKRHYREPRPDHGRPPGGMLPATPAQVALTNALAARSRPGAGDVCTVPVDVLPEVTPDA